MWNASEGRGKAGVTMDTKQDGGKQNKAHHKTCAATIRWKPTTYSASTCTDTLLCTK
jgi:hypothetical protein